MRLHKLVAFTFAIGAVITGLLLLRAQTAVTLSPAASPAAGQAGVTSINVTGSGFPTGTILPANTDVKLEPAAGGGSVSTKATAVTTVVGTTRRVTFLIPASISVASPTAYLVSVSGTTSDGTAFASSNKATLTINPPASISSVVPNTGQVGQSLPVTITGQFTNFVQSSTQASFGVGISVGGAAEGAFGSVTVTSPTTATAQLTINPAAVSGPRDVSIRTGVQQATLTGGFNVSTTPGPTISDFSPKSAPIGTPVTITGANLSPNPQVTLSKQGGGVISAPVDTVSAGSITFTIPTGAATGTITVAVNNKTATSTVPLTIVTSTTFTLTALPPTADLIQGQSVSLAVNLASANGFSQLAGLSVSGLPAGVSASFKPQQITAGQTSLLTLTAPAGQALGTSNPTISAAATIEGIPVSQSAGATINVVAPTTSFIGRSVVDDATQTPIAGVTVRMLGLDGSGGTTGCTGTGLSDAAGNIILKNLPPTCAGSQLIGFDGTTATSPPGKYAGVNVTYTLTAGQVTAAPLLVHLPRIDDKETFLVQQNAAVDQSYSFASVPGLSVTVYKGTTFTMPDGTQPNPFPLAGIQVPIDRLPDVKPPVPTMVMAFIVAFQPANATANQPVAVYYPNTIKTAPGINMTLMTLDPTRGTMVPYGTGTVAPDGTQIIPDSIPGGGGKRYGIVHFDWHSPMPPPPPPSQPPPTNPPCTGTNCFCPIAGKPVQLVSGVEMYKKTDISFGGSRGTIAIIRTYRTLTTNSGPFGIGGNHNYGYSLDSLTPQTAPLINLVTPDYNFFPFRRQPSGTLINTTDPAMLGAVMYTFSDNSVSLRWKNGTVYQFNPPGSVFPLLHSVTDANGSAIVLTRNPARQAQITQITDPVGRNLTITYDARDRITSITDPIGRQVLYTYNALGTLATVTDLAGGITKYDYLSGTLLQRITDPRNVIVIENTYDANGRVIQQKQADGGIITISYTLANPLAPTSPIIQAAVTDPLGHSSTYRFNTSNYITDSTDAQGHSRILELTGGNLISSIKGDGGAPGCGSAASGDIAYTNDPVNGNVLTQTDSLGNASHFTYDPVFNKVVTATDPLGNTTAFSYDSRGNLVAQTDANNHTTQYKYDGVGQLVQVIDPLNQITKFSYDAFGNLISLTDPLGNTSQYRYDAISRQVETVDALGRKSAYGYDPLSRLIKQTDPKGGATTFQYDGVGNLISVTDARGNKTQFTYDGMNRLLTRTTPLNKSDSRTYDLNGNLTQFMDRRGQISTFSYDPLNRLISETYPDSTVVRTYDSNGRLVNATDSIAGIFTSVYDSAGRLTRSSGPTGTIQYTRDGLGRVSSRQVVGQPPVAYSYDAAGNLLSSTSSAMAATYSYSARNEALTLTRGNGVSTAYAYDSVGRVLSLMHAKGPTVINSHTYNYDPVGNRTVHVSSNAQPLMSQAIGGALYDASNEQLQFGSINNTFDANGNLSSSVNPNGTTAYTWDSRNRLATVSTPSGQLTRFTYDVMGNIIQQADTGPSLNVTQSFVLDDLTNVVSVSRSDGDQYSVLTGQSLDEHLAIAHITGQIEYSLEDAVNSTVATVDQAGVLKGQFAYEPFGQTTATASSYPFEFTGRLMTNPMLGLYNYRSRFYSSDLYRFLSEDAGASFVNAGTASDRYAYVDNDPVDATDPLGLAPTPLPPPTAKCWIEQDKCGAACYGRCKDDNELAQCVAWCHDKGFYACMLTRKFPKNPFCNGCK